MTIFQTFQKHKLPITINPLDYGKLLYNKDNLYVMWTSKIGIAIIHKFDLFNNIKYFVNGQLIFEYRDNKISDDTFVRTIGKFKFEFKNNKLISVKSSIVAILISNLSFRKADFLIYEFYLLYLLFKNYFLRNHFLSFFIFYELLALFLIYYFCFIKYPQLLSSGVLVSSGVQNILKFSPLIYLKRNFSEKKYYKNTLNSIFFNLNNQIFSIHLLEAYFNKFWKIVSPKIEDGCHIFVLLKFQFEDGNFHNIGKLIKLDKNKNNYKTFIDQIASYMENMGDYYNQSPIQRIIFSYGFKRGEISEVLSKKEINLINFKDMKLPISIDPNDYGKILSETSLLDGKIYLIQDKIGKVIEFKEFEKENIVIYNNKSIKFLEFKDNKFSESKFLRILGNRKLFFENGSKTIDLLTLVTPFISKLKNDKIEINNFITLDIETYGDTVLTPYLISFYDGVQSYSFYLSDFESVESMIKACFDKLFIRKYNYYSIYVHNLVKFDIIFLFKYLIKYVSVDPVIHRGRIIQLNLNYGPDLQYKMSLKDSYLILLSSLEKLGIDFGVEIKKSIFPHKFVNENNLNYIGHVPSIDNFFKIDNLTYYDFSKYFGGLWSLKSEAIKYCEIDCVSLYQIILKFNSLIFELFSKNIHNYPTLPSLAFAIFRGSFMKEENIMHPIIQVKHKTEGGIKTIYPVGTWSMWIFSEEMYNASKYGYTFEILEGYKFERGIIFKNYVDFLYQLRQQYDKSDPYNLIGKILLNSLYGRFGMNQVTIRYELISKREFLKFNHSVSFIKNIYFKTIFLINKIFVLSFIIFKNSFYFKRL